MADKFSVKVPWEGWRVTGTLGRGAFGRVYRIESELLMGLVTLGVFIIAIVAGSYMYKEYAERHPKE